ncbi:MAG: hypothetical protein P8O74_01595 [Paracoccaceae bacterium]|jgi:hypothetical protein|nr:hypothetical protein [Paracoccaceae bacterium]MDG1676615.1 hypothetical protein [Paracoccaceae bacterium]MDG2248705.1 hypothetical protein [Paracoccaceae bacterium]|tara:strand:- start:213 stop:620 length:408 start_codon:yes stop_codon:yes gene_type:complete
MKKIKQLNLLQTKEKLNQRKTISHLVGLKTEAEKCRKVSKELEEITKRKNNKNQEITTYSFQADRQLVQKLMEQREIISNRQEFLKQEQVAINKEISNSKAKTDILEKKKLKEKVKVLNKNDLKLEDQYNQISKR